MAVIRGSWRNARSYAAHATAADKYDSTRLSIQERAGMDIRGGGGASLLAPPLPPPTDNSMMMTKFRLTWTPKFGEIENGIFGISATRGFRKVLICLVFVKKKFNHFGPPNKFSPPSAPELFLILAFRHRHYVIMAISAPHLRQVKHVTIISIPGRGKECLERETRHPTNPTLFQLNLPERKGNRRDGPPRGPTGQEGARPGPSKNP